MVISTNQFLQCSQYYVSNDINQHLSSSLNNNYNDFCLISTDTTDTTEVV